MSTDLTAVVAVPTTPICVFRQPNYTKWEDFKAKVKERLAQQLPSLPRGRGRPPINLDIYLNVMKEHFHSTWDNRRPRLGRPPIPLPTISSIRRSPYFHAEAPRLGRPPKDLSINPSTKYRDTPSTSNTRQKALNLNHAAPILWRPPISLSRNGSPAYQQAHWDAPATPENPDTPETPEVVDLPEEEFESVERKFLHTNGIFSPATPFSPGEDIREKMREAITKLEVELKEDECIPSTPSSCNYSIPSTPTFDNVYSV